MPGSFARGPVGPNPLAWQYTASGRTPATDICGSPPRAGPPPQPALPAPNPRQSVTLISENDSFAARTDRYYTNGIRLGYRSAEGALQSKAQGMLDKLA